MSIVAYTGLPGSGKSYGVVANVVLPAYKSGRTIVTNIPVKADLLARDYPHSGGTIILLEKPEISEFQLSKHPGAVWIIDECQHYYPQGQTANKVSDSVLEFFTQHRHSVGPDGRTAEIVLVTQDLSLVAKYARDLVEDTYRVTKLSVLGASTRYKVHVYQGPATGPNPKNHYRLLQGKYQKKIYQYYQSHTQVADGLDHAAGLEEKTDSRANIWRSGTIMYGLPIAALFIAYAAYSTVSYFSPDIPQINESQPDQSLPAVTHNLQSQVDAPQRKYVDIDAGMPPLSDEWRIVGQYLSYVLIDSPSGWRHIPVSLCPYRADTYERYCIIAGQMVTEYSGINPQNVDNRENVDIIDNI